MRLVSAIAMVAGAAIAQTAAPQFETATIQESREFGGRSSSFTAPGKLMLQNQTLEDCARIAWDVKVARIAGGGPKWVESQHFDIDVQAAGPVDDAQMRAMLRALLEKRFKLRVHRETRTFGAYALMLAKGGLKVPPVEPGPARMSARHGFMMGESASMANLAQALSDAMNTPVVDMTATPGVFSFMLEWIADPVQPGALTADDQEPTVLPDLPRGPSLFAALPEQLGLKLEGRKVRLDVVIIDQAERPQE